MTSEVIKAEPIATSEVALVVTTLDTEALDRYIVEMPAERVAEFVIRLTAAAKMFNRAKQVATARLVELDQTGAVFTDPADGTQYHFTGGRHRRIKDIIGFLEALAAQSVRLSAISPWVSSVRVGADIQGDERVKEAVKEFAVWEDDSLSMVELDERGKPVRR